MFSGSVKSRLIGRFRISDALIRPVIDGEEMAPALSELFSRVVVIDVNYKPDRDVWEYIAAGPFDEVLEGDIAPLYECIIHQYSNSKPRVEFRRAT